MLGFLIYKQLLLFDCILHMVSAIPWKQFLALFQWNMHSTHNIKCIWARGNTRKMKQIYFQFSLSIYQFLQKKGYRGLILNHVRSNKNRLLLLLHQICVVTGHGWAMITITYLQIWTNEELFLGSFVNFCYFLPIHCFPRLLIDNSAKSLSQCSEKIAISEKPFLLINIWAYKMQMWKQSKKQTTNRSDSYQTCGL